MMFFFLFYCCCATINMMNKDLQKVNKVVCVCVIIAHMSSDRCN